MSAQCLENLPSNCSYNWLQFQTLAHSSCPPKSWFTMTPSSVMHRAGQTVAGGWEQCLSKSCFNRRKCSLGYFIRQQPLKAKCPLFLSQTPLLMIISVQFSLGILFICWCSLFGYVSVYFVVPDDTKWSWQGKSSAYSVCICAFLHTHMSITGKKMLVYFPDTDIRIIYPHVLNLFFPKLSGQKKCLFLIAWTSISISLKFGKKNLLLFLHYLCQIL